MQNLDEVDFLFLPLRGDYLRLCGPEAVRWVEAVRTEEVYHLAHETDRAMQALRGHELEVGRGLLTGARTGIERLVTSFSSIRQLLLRYFFAAHAYLHYLQGDMDSAKRDLRQAKEALVAVLTRHPFLRPLAIHFIDLLSQEARIARRRCRWVEAKARIETIREIFLEDRRFCTLGSGEPLRLSDLRTFFALLPLDASQQEQAKSMLGDDGSLDRRARLLEEQIFSLPDFVIPYP